MAGARRAPGEGPRTQRTNPWPSITRRERSVRQILLTFAIMPLPGFPAMHRRCHYVCRFDLATNGSPALLEEVLLPPGLALRKLQLRLA
jgi:hypothetical protein